MKKKFRWMAAMLAVIIAISQFGAAAPMTAHAAFEETMSEDLEEVLTQEDAEEPEVVTKGWYQVEDDWYYNDAEGNQVFDWQEIDGFWYYFDKNNAEKPGVMLSNCKRVIRGCTYFFNGSGQMQTGWIQRAEGWYYTNDQGAMITGWKFIGNFWYYLDGKNFKTPGLMLRDCKKILDGKTYIFNGSGQMKRGWAKRPEGWYYTADSGEIITGWKFVDAQWYYLMEAIWHIRD